MDFGKCEERTRKKLILLEEKRSKLTLHNADQQWVRRITVDGCMNISGPRCDYLVITADATEYFVELKGSNVRRAFDQIEATIRKVSKSPSSAPKHSRIVSVACPIHRPEIQKKRLEFKKEFNSTLLIVRSGCVENI